MVARKKQEINIRRHEKTAGKERRSVLSRQLAYIMVIFLLQED